MSTATQLRTSFNSITERLETVLDTIPVTYSSNDGYDILIVAPEHYWNEPTPEQQNALMSIKRDYEHWIELIKSTFRSAPNDLTRKISEGDTAFRKWLELQTNWNITCESAHNIEAFRGEISTFNELLQVLESKIGTNVIIVPDTNSIVANPDPVSYASIAGADRFTFLLLPTVLSELDELKNLHRNPDFRDKAKAVVTRIKGWRNQGALRDGVTVSKTITIRAIAAEPNMKKALSWLDPENKDDRIIASILELHATHPSDKIILVTGDINLSNKAEAAHVTHAEL